MKVQDLKEGGGYVLKNTSRLMLPILGSVEPFNLDIEAKLFSNYNLREVNFKINSKRYFFKGFLKNLRGNLYSLTIKTPNQNIEKNVFIKNELVSSLLTPISLNYVPLRKKIAFSFYDPFLNRKTDLILENKGKEIITFRDRRVEVYVIDMDVEGVKGKIFVDHRGRMIKEEFLGFKFIKEDLSVLVKEELPPATKDLIQYFTIKVRPLLDKSNLNYLKVKIKGISKEFLREDFNQKTYPQDDGFIVEIYKKEAERISKIPLMVEGFEEYLEEDDFIKFRLPSLQNTVHSIVGGEKNALEILKRLSSWINKNIEKIPTVSLPNTLDVLKIRQGDCGELSALLVGFLRSLGIPSYVNIGLVYEEGRFFYHAWVSLYVGEWIDTDPALNQLIADPTHIKLLKGFKDQFEIFKIIGKLQIEIIDYN
jgi:hypothetical protein